MRPISQIRTLVYYDGVQVFEGRDSIGGHHVGVLIDDSGAADRYLVAGVDPERLRQFRAGAIDLRTLFLEAGAGEWRLADVGDGFRAPVTPIRPEDPGACTALLPDEGFILHDGAGNDETIQLKPHLAEAYNNRGGAEASLGRYDEAISDYDKAIQLEPDYAGAYDNRGSAKASLGRYDEAISDYDKAIQLEPDYAGAYDNRGSAKASLGRYDEAISDYDKAIQLEPDYAGAYDNRGSAKASLGRYDEAISDYDKAIQINSDYAEAFYNRGVAKAQHGLIQEFQSDFDRAIMLARGANNEDLVSSAEKFLKTMS